MMDFVCWIESDSSLTPEDRIRWTKWHYDTATYADATGRTGCGKRYPRLRARYRQDVEGIPARDLCRSCQIAAGGTFPGDGGHA